MINLTGVRFRRCGTQRRAFGTLKYRGREYRRRHARGRRRRNRAVRHRIGRVRLHGLDDRRRLGRRTHGQNDRRRQRARFIFQAFPNALGNDGSPIALGVIDPRRQKDERLRRNPSPPIALTKKEEPLRKVCKVVHAAGDSLRQAAKQRKASQSDHQRGDAQPGNQPRVQFAAQRAEHQG